MASNPLTPADSYSNPLPPSSNFNFECTRVKMKFVFRTAFGTPIESMSILDEDDFVSVSESDLTDLSSEEGALPDSPVKINPTPSTSVTIKKEIIKEERLSDSDSSKRSKHRKKKTHKRKGSAVVDYSDSEDSEDSWHDSRLKAKQDNRRVDRGNRNKERSDADRGNRNKERSDSEDRADYHREDKYDVKRENFEYEHNPDITFGSVHCRVCNIVVNSELTYQTHIRGKRHQKALKARNVPAVAIKSLCEAGAAQSIHSLRKPRRIPVNDKSHIQNLAYNYQDDPIPGLSEVIEIRPSHSDDSDISYFCSLCEAKCMANSIMPHLIGYKHYLRCLEKIDPKTYERYRYKDKRHIGDSVRRILYDHERKYGRGRIRVEKEIDEESFPMDEYNRRNEPEPDWRNEPGPSGYEPRPSSWNEPGPSSWNEPGPSWRDDNPDPFPPNSEVPEEYADVSAADCLDTSMNDFYCKVCDSHMNKREVWENHVKGKRHLKNIKKQPGESSSKVKHVHCPGATPNLAKILEEDPDVYVGLGYIKENQNLTGDQYNCFLCGACNSSYDIKAHLTLLKHRIKYLEAMNAKGCKNAVEEIKSFHEFSSDTMESLIIDECKLTLDKYGQGEVSVYRSKDILTPPFKPRY